MSPKGRALRSRLYTWGSGRFSGVGLDANYLVERIEEAGVQLRRPRPDTVLSQRAFGS